jgi:hypothetical protein
MSYAMNSLDYIIKLCLDNSKPFEIIINKTKGGKDKHLTILAKNYA